MHCHKGNGNLHQLLQPLILCNHVTDQDPFHCMALTELPVGHFFRIMGIYRHLKSVAAAVAIHALEHAEGDVVLPLPFQQIRNDQGDPVALFTGKVTSVDIRLISQSACRFLYFLSCFYGYIRIPGQGVGHGRNTDSRFPCDVTYGYCHKLSSGYFFLLFDTVPSTLWESRKLFICTNRPIIPSISCSEKFFVMPFTLLRIRFR